MTLYAVSLVYTKACPLEWSADEEGMLIGARQPIVVCCVTGVAWGTNDVQAICDVRSRSPYQGKEGWSEHTTNSAPVMGEGWWAFTWAFIRLWSRYASRVIGRMIG
jgi:hypothetical protein